MGHQLDLGNNVLDLWEYALGSDATCSFKYDNRESFEDISKETWRRISNNLPYILKHKGTARSIKALLACYGVPNTINASFYALFIMLQNMKSNYPICVSQIILDEIDIAAGKKVAHNTKLIGNIEEQYLMDFRNQINLYKLETYLRGLASIYEKKFNSYRKTIIKIS